jgi:hypothetical protein
MSEVYFIDDAYLIRFSWLNGTTDQDYLKPAIRLAQLKRLRYYIGTCLYDRLISLVENQAAGDNTSINHVENVKYKTLLDDHVQDVVMYWTLVELYPYLVRKVDNASILKRVSNNTETLSNDELMDMVQTEQGNAQFFTDRMLHYLKELEGADQIDEFENCDDWEEKPNPKYEVEWNDFDSI